MSADIIDIAIDYTIENSWHKNFMVFHDVENACVTLTKVINDVSRIIETVEVSHEDEKKCIHFIVTFPHSVDLSTAKSVLTSMFSKLDEKKNDLLQDNDHDFIRFTAKQTKEFRDGPGLSFQDLFRGLNTVGWVVNAQRYSATYQRKKDLSCS